MTQLRLEPYTLPAADLGPENPFPVFRHAEQDSPVKCDDSVPQEDRRYLGWRTGYRVLPHRLQDGYNRLKRPRAFQAAVLENEVLCATFLPEVGGKLWSLVHKPSGRELLERNPVFQPANLALRNAWCSGGIEWNTSQLGHYYLTCAPVFAARVAADAGYPVLRLYEWDRVKCFPWQTDFHLPPGSPFLFSRVRLVNPHDCELPMYWWTNIAVTERPDTRTLVPAAETFREALEGMSLARLPRLAFGTGDQEPPPVDATYPTNAPQSGGLFFRILDEQRPWIAALDSGGRGLVHASTARLRGRKMFFWGMGEGGRRWQEYLAQPGSNYIELQAGLARTQNECIPMPALAHWTWTEAFGLLQADSAQVHSSDWDAAWRAAKAALDATLPQAQLDARDKEFAPVTLRRPDEILARGSGWGALERRRLAVQGQPDRIPPELVFDNLGPDQEPWLALLETGTLPARDPASDPGHWMVQPAWRALLERNVNSHWLTWLHLGVMRLEAGERDEARAAWRKSLELQRNGWALRNLAMLETWGQPGEQLAVHSQGVSPEAALRACELLRDAWDAGPRLPALAVEYARMLLEAGRHDRLREFTAGLPGEIRANERIRLLAARAALQVGAWRELESLFGGEFATIREGEVTLTELWYAFHAQRLAATEKIPLDDALRQRVRREFPAPRHIDFRMAHEGQEPRAKS